MKTADLCDAHDDVQVAEPVFRDYGARREFAGPIATVRVQDDNTLVRQQLETPGGGRVLVVDNGGSIRCAMIGDRLGRLAEENGWVGIVVHGCIRDADDLAGIQVGLKAIGTVPRRSGKTGGGETGVPVEFAGVRFAPGAWIYADADGIVVAAAQLDGASPASG